MGDALEDWPTHGVDGLSERTVTLYRGTISKALSEELGKVRLTELTASDVQVALATLAERLSTRTVQIAHNVLVRAIRHAERDDLVGRNVAALVDAPKGQQAGRPSKPLTLEQAVMLMREAKGTALEAYIVVSLPQLRRLPGYRGRPPTGGPRGEGDLLQRGRTRTGHADGRRERAVRRDHPAGHQCHPRRQRPCRPRRGQGRAHAGRPRPLQELVSRLLVSQPGGYMTGSLDLPPVTEIGLDAACVLCADDIALARPGAQFAARLGTNPLVIPGNHMTMLTQPATVADALLSVL